MLKANILTWSIGICLPIILNFGLFTDAHAKKSVNLPLCFFCIGASDELELHEELPNGLGHLATYKVSYWLLAGVWVSSETVIAISRDSYSPIPKGQDLKELQESGILPDPIPDYGLNALDYILGYSLWLVAAVILIIGYVTSSKNRENDAISDLKQVDEIKDAINSNLLSLLCIMAKADGKVLNEEIELIQSIYENFSGESISISFINDKIEQLKDGRERILQELNTISNFLSDEGKKSIIYTILMVAARDGEFDITEQQIFTEVASAINIDEKKLDEIVASFLSSNSDDKSNTEVNSVAS